MVSGKASVLFVDDDFDNLKAMRRMTDPKLYDVCTASGGEEAIRVMQKSPVDVVVSDYSMPLMNGMALLLQLKVMYPKTARILCTGQGDMELLSDAINHAEIFRFLAKPVSEADLGKALLDAVRHLQTQG
jgi:response regulator RpfG family c-di-GMP phosphodiesterase